MMDASPMDTPSGEAFLWKNKHIRKINVVIFPILWYTIQKCVMQNGMA